jgi:phage terminase large subunit-like protein
LWCFHQSRSNSVELQQKLMFRMLPPEYRRADIRERVTYIKYSIQNGFTGDRFVLPNRSECGFRNYEQDRKEIEGGEQDGIWCDEHVPGDWLETLKSRIATRAGWLIVTCTPTEGYSPVVRMFEDGADTMLRQVAYLLPKDGKAPDIERAMDYEALEKLVRGMKN